MYSHDLITRRSVTGILRLLNNTPVRWLCKQQMKLESSRYGSELVALCVSTKLILETRYMLKLLGAQIDSPVLMLGDKMSVVLNTTVPSSVVRKKCCAIIYHGVCEAIVATGLSFAKIPSTDNIVDVFTGLLGHQSWHCLIRDHRFWIPKTLEIAAGNNLEAIHLSEYLIY